MVICTSCQIQITDAPECKDHYKSDFHKHNIKRKTVNLNPLTYEQFKTRVEQLSQSKQTNLEQIQQKKDYLCELCKKHFSNENQLQNHYQSKKHKEMVKTGQSKSILSSEVEQKKEIIEEEKSVIASCAEGQEPNFKGDAEDGSRLQVKFQIVDNSQKCFFCPVENELESLEENLRHMSIEHSFFIPDVEEVTDLSCIINYLYEKVMKHAVCLFCESEFGTGDSTKQHMRDKQHCFMGPCDDYEQFYEGAEEEWQDDSEEEAQEVNQENIQKKEEQQQIVEYKAQNVALSLYGFRNQIKISENGELELPNKILGHRDFKGLYKQHYKPEEQQVQIAIKNNMVVLYQKLGFQFKNIDIRCSNLEVKNQKRYQLAIGKNGNMNLQHHFRYQNPL